MAKDRTGFNNGPWISHLGANIQMERTITIHEKTLYEQIKKLIQH